MSLLRYATLGGDVFRDEYSLSFDGTNDKLVTTVPSSTFHGDFSFSTWVKRGETGSAGEIADGFAADNDGFKLFFRSSDDLRFSVDDTDVTTSASFTNTDRWYHIVAVQNDTSNTQQLYIDGVLDASGSGDVNLDNTNNVLEIGDTLLGNISDIAIYNTALTASQVRTIYNGREPYNHKEGVASGNLVSWWRMGDGALDDKNGLVADQTSATIVNHYTTDFSASTGWNGSYTVSSNQLTKDDTGLVYRSDISLSAGDIVKFTVDTESISGSGLAAYVGGVAKTIPSTGVSVIYISTTAANQYIGFNNGNGSVFNSLRIDKIGANAGTTENMTADDFTGDTP